MRSAEKGLRLGIVTYRIGEEWDLATLVKNSEELGLACVELRTTHAHGVELSLSSAERADVKARFDASPVELWCLGSVCDYHSADPSEVEKSIEETKRWIALAREIGAVGVKVRPNGLPPEEAGVPVDKTLEQIGKALKRCAEAAAAEGVKLWCEVHGRGTSDPPRMRKICEIGDHPNLAVVWNCNQTDLTDGSVKPAFEMLGEWLGYIHLHEMTAEYGYPYAEFFELLAAKGYRGPMLAEIGPNPEGVRLMRYFRDLWKHMTREAGLASD
jgi:sugar phosphate isomerase/epimerase